METIKIKPTHPESQGDHVVINAADFDPSIHQRLDEKGPTKPSDGLTVEQLKTALGQKGIQYAATALKPDLQDLLDNAPA